MGSAWADWNFVFAGTKHAAERFQLLHRPGSLVFRPSRSHRHLRAYQGLERQRGDEACRKPLWNKTTFDENITEWDVSNVTNMRSICSTDTAFNQPIGDWNVSALQL